MSYKKRILLVAIYSIGLALFLILTNPNTLALGFLAVPIILVGAIIYQVSKLTLTLFSLFASSPRKQHTISLVIAVLVTGAFVFQSVGRLTVGDLAILLVFSGLSIFYLIKLL